MLLTCPTCRSSLQVPDGTTAAVRCPTCRTVFSASHPIAPPAPPPTAPESFSRPQPIATKPTRPVRHTEHARREETEPEPHKTRREQRDEKIQAARTRQAHKRERDELTGHTAAERAMMRAQFERATWGCRLLGIAFGLYGGALLLLMLNQVVAVVAEPMSELVLIAGLLGGLNWLIGAIGVGLCIAGRPSPGHYGFGIAAAIALVVHGILLLAVLLQTPSHLGQIGDGLGREFLMALQLPTKLDSLAFYLAALLYPDEKFIPHGAVVLILVTGVAELVRLLLIMMLVSCLARAAGDPELSHRCTRAAGIGTFGPGVLAVALLALSIALVETGGMDKSIGKILLTVFGMGVYAILAGMLMPSFVAIRDTTEACEAPYQSQTHDLAP